MLPGVPDAQNQMIPGYLSYWQGDQYMSVAVVYISAIYMPRLEPRHSQAPHIVKLLLLQHVSRPRQGPKGAGVHRHEFK